MAALRKLRVLAFLLAALASLGLVTGPSPLSPPQPVGLVRANELPNTDVNPLGATFFLDREVEGWKKDLTLRMAREAGIGWAKIHFSWEGIEPRRGQYYDDRTKTSTWDKYDELVRLAEQHGLRVIARLDRPPAWAHQQARPTTTPPGDFNDYGDFVYAVVSRFRDRVQYFQIWNEPNLGAEWGFKNVDPAEYTRLLKVAYKRAKEANPNAVILSAPLAQTLETGPLNLNEFDYLEQMYRVGAGDYFDVLMANGYGFDRSPDDPPQANVLNFQRVLLLRRVMEQNGDGRKAVWLNEFGWNAAPANFPKDRLNWQRVSEEQQAAYTLRGIELARSWGWVGVVSVWYFRQVGDIRADDATYYFRMVDANFTPRLVYQQLKHRSPVPAVAGVGVHQETSPAAISRGAWRAVLDPAASGGQYEEARERGATITFRFNGTDVDLLAATGPGRGSLAVKIDGSSNGSGGVLQAVNLATYSLGSQTRVPLARGLAPGEHRIELTAENGGRASIDAFHVTFNPPSYTRFYASGGVLAAGLCVSILSFFIRRKT